MWAKLRQKAWRWRGVWVVAPSMAGLLIALRLTGWLQFWELAAFDQFFRWRPPELPDPQIVIVGIDEADLQKIRHWPVSDEVLAQLLEKLKQQKPSVIGLDLYRDLPVNPGHQKLVKVFASTPNLIGVEKVVGGTRREVTAVAAPRELAERGQVSAADMVVDADGKVRRGLLYLTKKDQTIATGLGLRLAQIYLETKNVRPRPAATNPQHLQLGEAVFVPFAADDGGYVRTSAEGYQILLNLRGPRRSFRTVSMSDVLEDRVPPNLFRGRIVLVGTVAESLRDVAQTSYTSPLTGSPRMMDGVEVHANLASQLVNSALGQRPLMRTWHEPLEWLWILGWSIFGAALSWQWRLARNRSTSLQLAKTAVGILIAEGSLLGGGYLAFLQGWWLPVIPPAIALVGSATIAIGLMARTAAEVRKTFGRYLSDEVVATLLEAPEGWSLGGERKKVTILMSDLRGFSSLAERLPPEQVVAMLNIYLESMVDVIMHYNGIIDEIIGDGILVIFGAPTQREDDAARAVACAVAMQLAIDKVNTQNEKLKLPKVEMGIGINTGEVVVGNIGSQKRAKYAVVGSCVNLTARIEAYTVGGQILLSEFTFQEIAPLLTINQSMQVEPKGSTGPITVYDLGGIGGKYNLFLPSLTETLCTLPQKFPIQYTVLEEKRLLGAVVNAYVTELSIRGAKINSAQSIHTLSDLKINLLLGLDGEEVGNIYAKVICQSTDDNGFYVRFTAIPPREAAVLSNLIVNGLPKGPSSPVA
ncbi:CHASE2 domain-containing protein [Leptolyngbya sp. FACHB-261]|uniref:CHASE2 domain-containing protein n=1 Tax=Leptolyngbya sp. FACHB-261 TaxID=2692806 RepID=UPI00168674D0|nr:adenylate/guanylate cyclase domain-containing protein [Leptolyngbya sp. FACHB-261]MBD2100200.1 adenylate/guanylate cyclase domain-containing protein [Leptolyngbya sp. FACHB-261]